MEASRSLPSAQKPLKSEMTVRGVVEWMILLLCAVSFAAYLFYSLAVAKYMGRYGALLGKLVKLLVG